jgi:AcrR family transcriptional regulator
MSPKPDVSETRKRQILEAAMKVFSRQGFHEARMDDIVQEAGLSKGALYWYFKSKDEVIMAILDGLFERELSGLKDLQDQEGPASDLLREFMQLTIRELKQMTRLLPIAYEFYALAFRNRTVREATKRYLQTYINLLTPLIQRGIDQGAFRPVNPGETAIAIGAMIEGALLLWVFDPERVDLERQLNHAMTIFLSGLEVR